MAGDTVQQIKERLSIQDIIAPYVKLRRAGRSLVGLCPFHKEKTPSFHVSSERGTWHCFGCGLGGDGFSFIEKVEGVDFKGALKMLAEKAGVTIEYSGGGNREDTSKQDRLRELMSRASEWYAGKLPESPAEAYALQRGLSDETIIAWRLGYAPDAWRALLEAMTAEGFTMGELLAAGLVKEADGKPGTYYDRFRNRLMFPIRDTAGRAVAFTGRTLDSSNPDSSIQRAKYLNSPETELYHKSEILFGMDRAKDALRVRGFTLLVEGQMDVILAHQAGFQNAVALSGTALSERHLSLMRRYSENLMLVLDADPAGLKATARSAALALYTGLRVKAARLSKGKDPADLIREDPNEFTKRITDAKPVIEFFLAELADLERVPYRFQRLVEEIVYPLLAVIPSPTERGYFIERTARYLSEIPIKDIRESVRRLPASPELPLRHSFSEASQRSESKYPELESSAVSVGKTSPLPKRSPRETRSEQLLAIMHTYPDTPLAERVKSEYCRITEAESVPQIALPEPVLFQAEQALGEEPSEDAVDELLRAFEEAVIREAYQEAVTQLRRTEASKDASLIVEAQNQCAKLSSRLAALHPTAK
jgi:DNA primase